MFKSFQCKNCLIEFNLSSTGYFAGFLKVTEPQRIVEQSFTGLFQQLKETIELSFIIDWNSKHTIATTAFYGNIKTVPKGEILLMDWLMTIQKDPLSNLHLSKDSIIMVSNLEEMDVFLNPDQILPSINMFMASKGPIDVISELF